MGTNYYARPKRAWDDDIATERPATDAYPAIHLGKHSGGWEFLFRAHPDLGLTTVTDLERFLRHPWVMIEDENGVEYSVDEFLQMATTRSTSDQDPISVGDRPRVDGGDRDLIGRCHRDVDGYPFADYEFC